jgi:hypothetical protein
LRPRKNFREEKRESRVGADSKGNGQAAAKHLNRFIQEPGQGICAVSCHAGIIEIPVYGARGLEGMAAMGNNHVFDNGVHGGPRVQDLFWLYVYPESPLKGSIAPIRFDVFYTLVNCHRYVTVKIANNLISHLKNRFSVAMCRLRKRGINPSWISPRSSPQKAVFR